MVKDIKERTEMGIWTDSSLLKPNSPNKSDSAIMLSQKQEIYKIETCAIFNFTRLKTLKMILLDFSITVKAATLIFISGRSSAISSAKQGNSGFIYNLVKSLSALWAAHFMKILTVYALNSNLLTLKAHNHKMYVFVVH